LSWCFQLLLYQGKLLYSGKYTKILPVVAKSVTIHNSTKNIDKNLPREGDFLNIPKGIE